MHDQARATYRQVSPGMFTVLPTKIQRMQQRINELLNILNSYSVEEINQLYRDKEVELEIESFTKHPDVRWSDSLKKKMIQAAKRKKIAPGRMQYLEDQIKQLNEYNLTDHILTATEDFKTLINNLKKTDVELNSVVLMHIEFSDFNPVAYVQLYGAYQNHWWENELGGFDSKFNSSKYWNEIDSNKFTRIREQLEIVNIHEEEYPSIFIELRELRVFNSLKKAINNIDIKEWIAQNIPNTKVEIGIHDDIFHMIYG